MKRTPGRGRFARPTSILAALCLGLTTAGAALAPATAAPAPQTATAPTALSTPTAPSVDQVDAPGGKSVVGKTSPIHDPALIIDDDGTWYVYSTGRINRENGGTIQIAASHDDGTTWEYVGTVWDEIPAWIDEHFAGGELPENLWAPEIYENDGTYYLYYSASGFGTANSLTALATNTTLDPEDPDYEWVDQGLVVSSPVVGLDPTNPDKTFNAIDAGIVEDADGRPYMSIGSFWYGIFLVPLEWPSGKPVADWQSQTVNIADRFVAGNPIEAPYIYPHDGYYYLFVSFDSCCQGGDSTYKVAVGRSESVTGPYLDKDGRDMFGGGGTVILDAHGAMTGPGGQSVFDDYLAFHYYDGSNEAIPYFPTLGLHKIDWVDGWPVIDQSVDLPAVAAQPADAAVTVDDVASFTAVATGTPSPVAVWQWSLDGATWVDVDEQPVTTRDATGAATSTLEITDLDTDADGLLVRATFHNAHGTATTEPATLTITAEPGDGGTDPEVPAEPGTPTEPGTPAEPGDGGTGSGTGGAGGGTVTAPVPGGTGGTTGGSTGDSTSGSTGSTGDLARTGSDVALLVLTGLGLAGAGTATVLAVRRARQRAEV
ncbi:arabinan endo-1,5-alpha-L-arabinosidase [Sanguibacter suaedae]|uniref:Arabinan endo-1,5-alpha-L-arabinosidase n=1 Tax=Sanguibacter suaedae TaxID=2795737 RepID=A0A934M8B9_9MICO|nr:arabinan endo-1,5-alpha-L-arabinosidase [Sanguibacter suaedae]MBI9113410.1 arabinan endo-1,5-alpha-L-arabinosidase [Sanguibacter suaedae]